MLVIADESMTKQICLSTQNYRLWDICFYLCNKLNYVISYDTIVVENKLDYQYYKQVKEKMDMAGFNGQVHVLFTYVRFSNEKRHGYGILNTKF